MKIKKDKIESLILEINDLIYKCEEAEAKYADLINKAHPKNQVSARNLVHYRAIRNIDLTGIQKKLGSIGLSRFARAQNHVLASLKAALFLLNSILSDTQLSNERTFLSIKKGEKLIRTHAKALLGNRSKGRRVRIMVTQPFEASYNEQLVHDLVANGMNSARINCAHDTPEDWLSMINFIRNASKRARRKVKVCMDLGGPKIRTGAMRPGPKVITFAPQRDSLGQVIGPAVLHLTTEWYPDAEEVHPLPLPLAFLESLQVDDILKFQDTRDKSRHLKIIEKSEDGWLAHCYDRSYMQTGMQLTRERDGEIAEVAELPPVEEKLLLREGDILILHRDPKDGEPMLADEDGFILQPAHVSCTSAEIFSSVEVGDRVLFDDGKIEGIVRERIDNEELTIEVTYARKGGQKLKADKGINLPDRPLNLRGLTPKDKKDLPFVVEHADVVNMSFVNTAQDVQDLLDELEALDGLGTLGIILKIETKQGFDNLMEIMLTAMQTYPVGIMIARGDLAVEVGWENMARIQEEILSLCLAAHMPDIWATQVLETLAKKGLPSRAEVTDAARAQRAECVMLNKGPYIVHAIQLLDKILSDMNQYQDKNEALFPKLHQAGEIQTEA